VGTYEGDGADPYLGSCGSSPWFLQRLTIGTKPCRQEHDFGWRCSFLGPFARGGQLTRQCARRFPQKLTLRGRSGVRSGVGSALQEAQSRGKTAPSLKRSCPEPHLRSPEVPVKAHLTPGNKRLLPGALAARSRSAEDALAPDFRVGAASNHSSFRADLAFVEHALNCGDQRLP
jgi:hypothetical protein